MAKNNKVKKSSPKLRKALKGTFWLLFVAGFLWASYFSMGYFLRNYLTNTVSERSHGIYELKFTQFDLLVWEMGFKLNGFELTPDLELYRERKNQGKVSASLYHISIPSCQIKGLNILDILFNSRVELNELSFTKPNVKILAHIDSTVSNEDREYDDVGPIVRNLMEYLLIHRLIIDEGIFDLFLDKEDRIESFTASKISLDLTGFKIDSKEKFGSKKFLYSEGYELLLQNYSLILSDGVHTLEANELGFSSKDSSIFARGFNLSPGQIHPDSLADLSQPYYHFFFPEFMVKGADIQGGYLTDTMDMRLVQLQRPNFQIFNIRGIKQARKRKEFKGFTHNIFPLIKGYLKEVSIDSLVIGNGTFDFYEPFESFPENIEIEGINVSLEKFKLDSTAYLDESTLLYAREFWLDLETFRMDLKDSLHQLSADSLFISSSLESIKAEGLRLYPKIEDLEGKNYIDISIPSIEIFGIDLIRAYHKNILQARLFDLKDPIIKAVVGKSTPKRAKKDPSQKKDLVKEISKYFDTVSVGQIKLENGTVDFSFLQNGRMETLKGDQINIALSGFEIDSMARQRKNRIFFSRHLEMEINDYDFLLDQLHEVKVRNMKLSTKKRSIEFRDIVFKPRDTSHVLEKLEQLKATTVFDFHIPLLSYKGVDIVKLVYQKTLWVKKIYVKNPVYNISVYPRGPSQKEIKPILEKDVHNIITSFFTDVKVEEFFAENALIHVSKEPHKVDQFWTKAPLDLRLLDLRINKKIKSTHPDNFFFSKDLQLTLRKYDLDLGSPGHTISADLITLSTRKKRLVAEGFSIVPKKYDGNLFPFKFKVKGSVQKLIAEGFDLKKFLEGRKIEIKSIFAQKPSFKYYKTKSFFGGSKNRKGPKKKKMKGIFIEKFFAQDGSFSLHDENGKRYFGTNFEGPILKLDLDDYSTGPEPSRFLTRQIGLDFTDGYFLFPDGLHKLEWKKLEINQNNAEISLYDGKLVAIPGVDPYYKLSRTQKSAYRSGSIKKVKVRGFDLDKFYQSGKVEIDRISIEDLGLIEFVFPQLRKKTHLELKNLKVNFPKGIKDLWIKNIDLKNFHFMRYNVQGDTLALVFEQGRIFGKVKGVRIRNGQLWDNKRIGFADDITLLVRNFKRKIPGAFMDITAKEVGISTGRNEAFVYGFHMDPWYGKYLHSRKLGYQVDRTELKVAKIFLKEIDILKLYHEQYLYSKKLLLEDLWVNDHRDKRVSERENFYPPMPQEILKKMKFRFNLDTVELKNGNIFYEEFVEGGKKPGHINFLDLNATLVNVTSDPEVFRQDPYLKMFGKAKLMGEGLVNFTCNLNIRDPGNKFDIWGTVGQMDMRKINPMVENVAFTTIKSGYIKSILFEASADDHYSTGTMKFRYSDFKIALINKETGQIEGIDKGFISFLANTFILNTKNPHLGFFREGSIFFKRNPEKSIINYWWKSIFTGIKTSIGAQNERKLHKIAEKTK
jgi:hypothetical protein